MTGASTLAADNKAVLLDFAPEEPISFSNLNVETIKKELAKQLAGKERLLGELSGGGISRNVLQRQINQIRERLDDIEQVDELEELDMDHRQRLELLERELGAVKSDQGTAPLSTPRFVNHDSTSLLATPVNNSTPTKRRSKVPGTGNRNTDVEFATEIGQGLLIEVRKLQAALQNKEEIIKQLHISKSDDERTTEMLMKHLKQKEESEERYKEQNWGLEVANEELRTSLANSSKEISKSKIENARLTKKLRQVSEQNDILTTQVQKAAGASESTKLRHEQDMQALRRTIANLQRENIGYKEQVHSLTNELDIQRTKLSLRSVISDGTNHEEKDKVIEPIKTLEIVPQTSTSTPIISNNPNLELTTTKQSLTHAHRMINNLRTSLHKEKQEKHELKKLLSDSQEAIELLQHDIGNFSTVPRNRTKNSTRIERKSPRRTKAASVKASMAAATAATEKLSYPDVQLARDVTDEESYSDTEFEEVMDDSASEKSYDPHTLDDASYMSNHAGMKSLGSELENSLAVQVHPSPANASSDQGTEVKVGGDRVNQIELPYSTRERVSRSVGTETIGLASELSQHLLDHHHVQPVTRQRTLSTSILEPLSVPPNPSNNIFVDSAMQYLDGVKPIVRQRTLSTSRLKPLSAAPVESNGINTAVQHLGEVQPIPRQTTLSTSALQPLSLPPIESNSITVDTAVQHLGEVQLDPTQSALSVSTLEPLSVAPVGSDSTSIQTSRQHVDEAMPVSYQQTLSTSTLEPLSLPPTPIDLITYQTIGQNLAPQNMEPLPRQPTLSTSTFEPLDVPPTISDSIACQTNQHTKEAKPIMRQRDLITSSLQPTSATPGSTTSQTAAQITVYDTVVQRSFNNHDDLGELEEEKPSWPLNAFKLRIQPPMDDEFDNEAKHTQYPEDMFRASAEWSSTPALSFGITPVCSFEVDMDHHNQEREAASAAAEQKPERMASSGQVELIAAVNAGVQVMDHEFPKDDRPAGLAIVYKNNDINIQLERDPIETVDSATSPIDGYFPIDIPSPRYVAGPNGEQMMTRKEAEALATAYIADALSKDKAQFSSERLAWEQGRLLKGSPMSFLSAPPRPERPPSPMLVAKTKKPPVAPKMHLTPSLKPSISTPVPSMNKGLRSKASISSIRSSMSKRSITSSNNNETKEDYGHVIIRKGSTSILPSASTSLASSPTESMNEHSLHRRPSLLSQHSFSLTSSSPTNLSVITAITKTMIGDWLWKHTRRTVGGGISEHRHRRFFWVHPYTRILYWSTVEPGVDGSEVLAKSAYVEAVMSVPNRGVLNDTSASLLIKTPNRELKLTAPDMESHALWYKSLSYLLDRPTMEQPTSALSIDSVQQTQSTRLPRKPSFQRMQSLFSRSRPDDASSITVETRRDVKSAQLDAKDESDNESQEDVRQCCDGKHHIHKLSPRATAQTTKQ